MIAWVVLAGAAAASLGLTGLIRRYALRHGVMDVPNERSSHTEPMPRGGGMAIVVTVVACVAVLRQQGSVPVAVSDRARWSGLLGRIGRLSRRSHSYSRSVALPCPLLRRDVDRLLPRDAGSRVCSAVVARMAARGCLLRCARERLQLHGRNRRHCRDRGHHCFSRCGAGCMSWRCRAKSPGSRQPRSLRRRSDSWSGIFRGQRSSWATAAVGFSASSFAGLSICAVAMGPNFFCAWLVLLGVFIVDASVTLFRRFLRRERLYVAHRAHAYQYASRRFGSHAKVSAVVAFINVAWLSPIALAVANGWLVGLLGVALAYVPLIALAFVFKAGAADLKARTLNRRRRDRLTRLS